MPLRESAQLAIAPPAPSETIVGLRWAFAAVQSGTLTEGSLGQVAWAMPQCMVAKKTADMLRMRRAPVIIADLASRAGTLGSTGMWPLRPTEYDGEVRLAARIS